MSPRRSLLCLAVASALSSTNVHTQEPTKPEFQFTCRPSASGQGWDCQRVPSQSRLARPPAPEGELTPAQGPDAPPPPLRAPPPAPAPAPAPVSQQELLDEARSTAPAPVRQAEPALYGEDALLTEHPDPQWRTCGPLPTRYAMSPPDLGDPQRIESPLELNADFAEGEVVGEGIALFLGDVQARRADQELFAAEVRYDRNAQRILAEGDVYYRDNGLNFTAGSADIDLNGDRGSLDQVDYRLPQRHARGSARRAEFEGSTLSRYEDLTYTTCLPDSEAWKLSASNMSLDRESGRGEARNVVLSFLGVPFLYTPYMSFPIDDRRKSGFLAPSLSSGDATGLDFGLPYYWNIAPNYDATITPRILTDRGLLIGGEFRFLRPGDSGELFAEILPDDRLAEDDRDNTRGQARIRYRNTLSPRLRLDADAAYVSDVGYLQEFGNSLDVTSTEQVSRIATLGYYGDFYRLQGRTEYFQTASENLAEANRAYGRLPQILFTGRLPRQSLGLDYEWRAEYVYFDKNDAVRGSRLDLYPAVSRPFVTPGAFLTPKVGVRHTQYSLTDPGPGQSKDASRTTPFASLDSGLIFERESSYGRLAAVNTLEPRLYYLYVKRENQDDIPIFDTSELDFNFFQLFRENRFTGADRMGDANQITAALTTRFLRRSNGEELLRASVGEIFYFQDREVVLPDSADRQDSGSDIVAELAGQLSDNLSTRATWLWDPDDEKTERSAVRLQYLRDRDHIFNLAYRYRRASYEQADFSARWPLARRWYGIARWDYSLRENSSVDLFAGVEYETCCYVFRTVYRQFVRDDDNFDDKRDALMFQVIFKGLTDLGNDIGRLMERDVLGYTDAPNSL